MSNTAEQSKKLEEYRGEINSILKTAKEFDMGNCVYVYGNFLKNYRASIDKDNYISKFYKEELSGKLGTIGKVLHMLTDTMAQVVERMPYKDVDERDVEKVGKLWSEICDMYLPYMILDVRAKIIKEYEIQEDSEYKKSLQELMAFIDKIRDDFANKHGGLVSTMQKTMAKFTTVNIDISTHMMSESNTQKVKDGAVELHAYYINLEKIANAYQQSINDMELLSA